MISPSGTSSAHPSTIAAQNRSLLEQIDRQAKDGQREVEAWQEAIRERDLQEKRRKAPGWLDGSVRLLEPAQAKKDAESKDGKSILDDDEGREEKSAKDVEDLGNALDRAFGRSEMG